MKNTISTLAATALIAGAVLAPPGYARSVAWQPAVEAKPLSDNVRKGIAWILEHQHTDGGWGQGEESRNMRSDYDSEHDVSNVGDTCISVLALIRSGSTPSGGDHAAAVRRGIDFVVAQVEAADEESLWVTDQRSTRLQGKLGSYIDTFMASLLLAEVKGTLPDEKSEQRTSNALLKVMRKIEKNQQADGSFGGAGWANALSQSVAGKGYNRAVQKGVEGKEEVRERMERNAAAKFDAKSGSFAAADAAGVDLYASASALGAMQESDLSNEGARQELEKQAAAAPTVAEREQAAATLKRYDDNARNLDQARSAVVEKMDDKEFISGFGSNGGEEFLSYMNIGESLVVKGGPEWETWDHNITANLNRIQNNDGSWTGHHCITGRNFCTAAALLVLMTDRAPVPVSGQLSRR